MEELLKELNYYYHISDDPRDAGEHPRCSEILDEITEEFLKMDEEKLRELLDSMDDDQLEQVTGALMDMPYEWVIPYEKL